MFKWDFFMFLILLCHFPLKALHLRSNLSGGAHADFAELQTQP